MAVESDFEAQPKEEIPTAHSKDVIIIIFQIPIDFTDPFLLTAGGELRIFIQHINYNVELLKKLLSLKVPHKSRDKIDLGLQQGFCLELR